MKRWFFRLICMSGLAFAMVSSGRSSGSFNTKTAAIECSGHEAITELASARARIPDIYLQSLKLGSRYPDHGGYVPCGIHSRVD